MRQEEARRLCCPGNRVQTVSGQRTRADSADWGKSHKDRDLSTGLRAMVLTGDRGQFQGSAGGERRCEREGPERTQTQWARAAP